MSPEVPRDKVWDSVFSIHYRPGWTMNHSLKIHGEISPLWNDHGSWCGETRSISPQTTKAFDTNQSQAESKLWLGQGICRKLLTWTASASHKSGIVSTQRKFNTNDSSAACFFPTNCCTAHTAGDKVLAAGVILRYILDWLIDSLNEMHWNANFWMGVLER